MILVIQFLDNFFYVFPFGTIICLRIVLSLISSELQLLCSIWW